LVKDKVESVTTKLALKAFTAQVKKVIAALFVYNVVLSALALYVLVSIWPDTGSSSWTYTERANLFFRSFVLSGEVTVLLIVIVMGALGALAYTATSLVTRVANRSFDSVWALWYLVHPLLGSSLAVVFYFALRGGLLNLSSMTTTALNVYGVAAVSGMVGLSSKEATHKLKEIFSTLFEGQPSPGSQKDAQPPSTSKP
jgi:hypothetical protein